MSIRDKEKAAFLKELQQTPILYSIGGYEKVIARLNKINRKKLEAHFETDEAIERLALAVTHFAFRNGPIEDMHASPNSQLSQEDMKILNKFCYNRLTYVFQLIFKHKLVKLNHLVCTYSGYGTHWDKPVADDDNSPLFLAADMEKALSKQKELSEAAATSQQPKKRLGKIRRLHDS